jgi:hypothetical protein
LRIVQSNETVLIGAGEAYKPACRDCHKYFSEQREKGHLLLNVDNLSLDNLENKENKENEENKNELNLNEENNENIFENNNDEDNKDELSHIHNINSNELLTDDNLMKDENEEKEIKNYFEIVFYF